MWWSCEDFKLNVFLQKKNLDEKWKNIIFESLDFSNVQIIAPTYKH
jgi:hypothetical protein